MSIEIHSRFSKSFRLTRGLLIVALSWAGFAVAHSVTTMPVTIELSAQVQVKNARVTLGDVAFLTTSDLGTMRRLMALPLGHAPRVGDAVTLDRDTLVRWMNRQAGLNTAMINWKGVTATEVSTASREVSGDAVVAVAKNALQESLSKHSVQVELQPISTPRDLMLPQGTLSFKVRRLPDVRPAKRMLVWVEVYSDGRFVRTVPVSFDVSAWAQSAVATLDVPAGGLLKAEYIAHRSVDIATLGHSVWSGDVDGVRRLRRAVRAGDVLTSDNIEPLPAVARGEWATLHSSAGAVAMESRVEVLQDGRQGQTVRVKQVGANGSVLARVIGPGWLEIQ